MAPPAKRDYCFVWSELPDPPRSDHIEGKLVENRRLGGLGILADQIDLAVRTATMIKTHDVTV